MIVFDIPTTTSFRGISSRQGILVEGPSGWGEFAPFVEYDDATAAPWLAAADEAAHGSWPEPVRDRVPVNVTVPSVTPKQAYRRVAASGCQTAKLKVGETSLIADCERVAAVRDALGSEGHIRVDANGAWGVDEAVAAIAYLDIAGQGLQYAEQPCRTVEELAAVRKRVSVLIAADESIRLAADPYRVRELDAADVVVLKVAPIGGVAACLRIAAEIELPVVVSSALDTGVGLAAGVALAAALPELPYACGLATGDLLADDLCGGQQVVDGALPVGRAVPDPAALAAHHASAEVAEWWRARLDAVRELTN